MILVMMRGVVGRGRGTRRNRREIYAGDICTQRKCQSLEVTSAPEAPADAQPMRQSPSAHDPADPRAQIGKSTFAPRNVDASAPCYSAARRVWPHTDHAQIWKPQVKKPSTALHAALE
jgi:hypothetical protein